jgi:hypothetical protein
MVSHKALTKGLLFPPHLQKGCALTYFQEQEQGHGEFSIENKEQTTPTTVQ